MRQTPEGNESALLESLSIYAMISGIAWTVLALAQICTCYLAIAGAWNLFIAITRFLLIERIKARDVKIPAEQENLALPVATCIVNLILGGVVGIAIAAFDFYLRSQILEKRWLFSNDSGAPARRRSEPQQAQGKATALDEEAMALLARIARLHQQGALSDAELAMLKQSILDQILSETGRAASSYASGPRGSGFGRAFGGAPSGLRQAGLLILANFAVMASIFILCVILSVLLGAGVVEGAVFSLGSVMLAAALGFGGSFLSLLISKPLAKWLYGIRTLEKPANEAELKLVYTIKAHAYAAGIPMPEVGIYESDEVNAFATGMTKSSSIVAVSSGLLGTMDETQLRGVLAHEVAHIANGDMATMALLQGLLNTFVICLSRIAANILASCVDSKLSSLAYTLIQFALNLFFSLIASLIVMAFSRCREYRADAGAVAICGSKAPIMKALLKLKEVSSVEGAVDESCASLATRTSRDNLRSTASCCGRMILATTRNLMIATDGPPISPKLTPSLMSNA